MRLFISALAVLVHGTSCNLHGHGRPDDGKPVAWWKALIIHPCWFLWIQEGQRAKVNFKIWIMIIMYIAKVDYSHRRCYKWGCIFSLNAGSAVQVSCENFPWPAKAAGIHCRYHPGHGPAWMDLAALRHLGPVGCSWLSFAKRHVEAKSACADSSLIHRGRNF